jgi:hypothetical protein
MEQWVIEKVDAGRATERPDVGTSEPRRFVLHGHRDDAGDHLDLRLEEGDVLVGWRLPPDVVEQLAVGKQVPCELKRIHPIRWLDVDEEGCSLEDSGTYTWVTKSGTRALIAFRGEQLAGVYSVTRQQGDRKSPADEYDESVAFIREKCGLDLGRMDDAAELVARAHDGDTARKRAVERLCALGRQLDGDSFDEQMWRKTLGGLSLREIHGHLRPFERRFDERHPPVPVTRQERLESDTKQRERVAAGILSEELSLRE